MAQRALRGLALGRKVWLFARPDRSGQGAALLYSLIDPMQPVGEPSLQLDVVELGGDVAG